MNTAAAITIAALAALTPTVTTLIGIILSRQDVRDLRSEMRSEIGGVQSAIGALRSEMIALRKDIHGDLLLIHERVATVEMKNNRVSGGGGRNRTVDLRVMSPSL